MTERIIVRTQTEEQKKPLRVAAYCRVSTDDPSQETSIEAQQTHWQEYIAAHEGWIPAGIYTEKGLSATKAQTRPELMRLLADCRDGRIDLVLTKSISRFSRNAIDCLHLVRTLKALGVGIVFEKECIDTLSMTSELFLSVLASFAAEESRSLSNNVKLGYRHRFQAGEFKYNRPPYGYNVNDGDLVADPEESAIVEEVFELVLSGHKPSQIAELLTERGIPTKYHAYWTGHTISTMVTNLTYTGDVLLQKTFQDENYLARVNRGEVDQYFVPEHHEAIISREVFILANRMLGGADPYERIRAAGTDLVPKSVDTAGNRDDDAEQTGEGEHPDRPKVTVIRADPPAAKGETQKRKLRVAAYCRVSTDQEEQESSYETQCTHYHDLITANRNWELVGIYADRGITGTSLRNRDSFNRMIEDAENGQIDLILTKSISRFARNTLDCLSVIRRLKRVGVGVTFEKEGLETMDAAGEVILTILASIAQQESASISQNVRLGIQYRFQQGIPKINCSRFLGYDKDRKGKLVINEAQAGIVRRIYRDYLDGFSTDMIAGDLRREGVPSGTGSTSWPSSSVRYILQNEKYAGNLLLQKYYVEDFLTHKLVRNRGQLPQYYIEGSHPPVIPPAVFSRVEDEMWLRAQIYTVGGTHFGSRRALTGRVYCMCGQPMKMSRGKHAYWSCSCGERAGIEQLRRQVMEAVRGLELEQEEIQKRIRELGGDLESGDRRTRAMARRREWQLKNLTLSGNRESYGAACPDEEDFRIRTGKDRKEWDDDALIRILDRVIWTKKTVFKGGVEIGFQDRTALFGPRTGYGSRNE